MRLAIQEKVLQGDSIQERLAFAKGLGIIGVEFDGERLFGHVPDIIQALNETDLQVSAIDIGCMHLLHPDYDERERAIATIRQGMALQLDLDATGVMFLPHCFDTPRLPDLHPYKSSIELEAELFVKHLKTTLLDLAYAMGATLLLPVTNTSQTHLVNSIERAVTILEKSSNSPHMKIAVDFVVDSETMLQQHLSNITYIRYHKVEGSLGFEALLNLLENNNYDGWLVVTEVDLLRKLK